MIKEITEKDFWVKFWNNISRGPVSHTLLYFWFYTPTLTLISYSLVVGTDKLGWFGICIFAYAYLYKIIGFVGNFIKLFNKNESNYILNFAKLIVALILSFSADYYCIYGLIPNSFNGISHSNNVFITYVEFFYFSTVTFATVGYGDIQPLHWFSKLYVSFEIIISLSLLIFVFSALHKDKPN